MNANAPQDESGDEAGGRPQSFDAALRGALYEVPVPDNLAERLIARFEAEASRQSRSGDALVGARRRLVRRSVLAAIGSLALAALVAVGINYLRRGQREVARDELGGEVASWMGSLPVKNWRPATTLPKGLELDSAIAAQPRQWQAVNIAKSASWPGTVTAIDLSPPTAPRAILFVVRSKARFAVPSAPTTTVRLELSSGYVGTAWQRSSGVLFVLVVEADRGQRLEDFLRRPAQA